MFTPLATALADRYTIERELGQGGMATVFLAQDLKHGREVALKVLRPELAAILGRERFLAEIRLTAKLDHPHILTLIDSGESNGFLWYVLPYIRGESLRARLERERQLELTEALAITNDIAGALDYAHRKGIIHRDVKPENILLHEGEAMLADFGIALAVREAGGDRLTETGLSLGTPQYMSPEQATAERQLDARSDVYSLGAVLYEMLAGEPPFSGPTAPAVIAKMMTQTPVRLRTVRETVPEAVDLAVSKALAKVPADRFPTAAAMATALTSPVPVPAASTPGRAIWQRPLFLAAGLALGLALIWLLARPSSRAATPRSRDPSLVALYQRALQGYNRRTPAGVADAIRDFSAVVERDSTYTEAWTGLANAYVRAYGRYFPIEGVPRDSMLRLAVAAADRALISDSGSAAAWLASGTVTHAIDPTDLGPALRSVRRAIALDSTSAPAWDNLAMSLAESGDLLGATTAWRRSVSLAPLYSQGLTFISLAYYWRRQYDSAAVWADSAIAVDPNFILARHAAGKVLLERGDFARAAAAFDAEQRLSEGIELVNSIADGATADAYAGRRREAQDLLARAESLATTYSPPPLHTVVYVAGAYASLRDSDRAIAWLNRYAPARDLHFQLHLRCDPSLAPIAGDPRFQALLAGPRTEQGC